MKIFDAKDYGMEQNTDITVKLLELLEKFKAIDEEKILQFDKGEYFLSSKLSKKLNIYITNTIGKREWREGEIPHENKTPVYIDGISKLTIDGNDSVFFICGQVTNAVIRSSADITLKNLELKTVNPDIHDMTVVGKKLNYVDFKLDNESTYVKENDEFYFVGEDYKTPFTFKRVTSWWIGNVKKETPDKIVRTGNPFKLSYKIVELSKNLFRAYYFLPVSFEIGETFCLFDTRRRYAGIFIDGCKNVVFDGVKQRFNYSLAVVCQHTENLTIKNCDFSPKGEKKMASLADFIQVCMCSGQIVITDNYFEGAGDDCLNVHGFHFKIKNIKGNTITVSFKHPQSYGFLPLDKGDDIEFVNSTTLLTEGSAKILTSKMVNEYDIELEVDNTDNANVGDVIEDISKCPDLIFRNNRINRIITRGILVTTRGKVLVENNVFNNNSMSGILISNDAVGWYESGRVEDFTIRNNTFNSTDCGYDILIKPENKIHKGYVHKNILIENNIFNSNLKGGIYVKSSDNVIIKDNIVKEENFKIINKNSNITEI